MKANAPDTEFSERYVDGMRDRMAVSYHKYGPVAEAYPDKVDAVASLLVRLARYAGEGRIKQLAAALAPDRGDGNTEWLMDVGNFAMIEFMHPRVRKAHYRATDSHESPGRVWTPDVEGEAPEVSQRANDYSVG